MGTCCNKDESCGLLGINFYPTEIEFQQNNEYKNEVTKNYDNLSIPEDAVYIDSLPIYNEQNLRKLGEYKYLESDQHLRENCKLKSPVMFSTGAVYLGE